jgi:hypothetical protein
MTGRWVHWLGLDAYYQPHELELTTALKEKDARNELEVLHHLKGLFEARVLR